MMVVAAMVAAITVLRSATVIVEPTGV